MPSTEAMGDPLGKKTSLATPYSPAGGNVEADTGATRARKNCGEAGWQTRAIARFRITPQDATMGRVMRTCILQNVVVRLLPRDVADKTQFHKSRAHCGLYILPPPLSLWEPLVCLSLSDWLM